MLGDLLYSRLTLAALAERARSLGDVLEQAELVQREPDRTGVIGDALQDRLLDPPYSIGDKLVSLGSVETLRCGHEADVAGTDQIGERQAAILVVLGHVDYETQISLY